jgi:hypothetical protein
MSSAKRIDGRGPQKLGGFIRQRAIMLAMNATKAMPAAANIAVRTGSFFVLRV